MFPEQRIDAVTQQELCTFELRGRDSILNESLLELAKSVRWHTTTNLDLLDGLFIKDAVLEIIEDGAMK